jgi:hypothetical protein
LIKKLFLNFIENTCSYLELHNRKWKFCVSGGFSHDDNIFVSQFGVLDVLLFFFGDFKDYLNLLIILLVR